MEHLGSVLAATATFVGGHFLLSHPLRRPLVSRMGEGAFLGLYSALFLGVLVWLVLAYRAAPDGQVWWAAGEAGWAAATLVMLAAAVLITGGSAGNPAMPDPTGQRAAPAEPRGLLAITRHPLMWGITLWAATHVAIWGSPRNLIVAVGMGLLAFVGAAAQDAKKERLLGRKWRDWRARTAFWPFAAQLSGRLTWRAAWPGWRAIAIGAVFWLAATWVHLALGGPPAGVWRWIGAGLRV